MYALELTELAIREESISNRKCFACGGEPSTGDGEHVIPLWLQGRFGLSNDFITLLNGTRLPYRSLKIPCCESCNNGFLSRIESNVKRIFETSSPLQDYEKLSVARWLSKILIGILVKETSLLRDRSNTTTGNILPSSFISELQHCHFIMQSARKTSRFSCLHSKFPFSLYTYSITDNDDNGKFDLSTNLIGMSISIRVGNRGAIFINDGGLQMEVGPKGPFELDGGEISALQFKEITARVHYKSALRDATHLYITAENDYTLDITQVRVESYSGYIENTDEVQIFRPWDETELSHFMAQYMGINREFIFDEDSSSCKTLLAR